MSLRRFISLMALAALSVMAVGAPVVQAYHTALTPNDDTMGTAGCVLTPGGVAGSAALAGEDGVNGFDEDTFGPSWDPLDLMDTDPGHFNFTGTARCQGQDLASEVSGKGAETFDVEATIIASGDFDNLQCGTGTANGDAVIRAELPGDPNPDGPDLQIYTEFGIHFVAGKGELVFVVDADETEPAAANPAHGQRPTAPDSAEMWTGSAMATQYIGHSYVRDNQIDGGLGTGEIDIEPTESDDDPPGGHCAEFGTDGNVRAFLVNGKFGGHLSGEGSTDVVVAGHLDSDG